MIDILIIGAGGHGQVVGDILQSTYEASGLARPIGYIDDSQSVGNSLLGLPILGDLNQLSQFPHDALVVAIGSNWVRASIWKRFASQGETFVNAIHPSVIISHDVKLGVGSVLCAGVIVSTGTSIGDNVILNTGCTIDHHNHIESHSHVAPGCHLGGEVHVSEGGFIGIGSSILPNRKIGCWATIGGGSLVNRDVESGVTVVGVPAKEI